MENKENSKSSSQSWWQTVPGILTAVAALITATGGLFVVLNQIGCFDKSVSKNSNVIQTSENKDGTQTENKHNSQKQNSEDTSGNTSGKKFPINLSKINDVNFEGNVYKFLVAQLDYYSPAKVFLKFTIRITSNLSGVYFSKDFFRLLVDDMLLAPETCNADWVEEHSSKDAEVVFVISNSTNEVQLQIGDIHSTEKGTLKIPINF